MLVTPRRLLGTGATLTVLALAPVAAGAFGAGASAQDPGARTIQLAELDRGSTFTHIRNTKGAPGRANLQGDVLAFTNPLADTAGKRVGRLSVSCVTTGGARNFMKSTLTCSGVIALPDGTLTLQANVSPRNETTSGAITGGTGAYGSARGVFVSTATATGSDDTITLTG